MEHFNEGVHYKVNPLSGCWVWLGDTENGYGFTEANEAAYRVSYRQAKGDIPKGMTVDHLCWYPRCINPEHLTLKTLLDNCRSKPNSVISGMDQATAIRQEKAKTDDTAVAIAERFGVTPATVRAILSNRTWFDPNYRYKPSKYGKRRMRKNKRYQITQARLLHSQGLGPDKIADAMGITFEQAKYWISGRYLDFDAPA